MRKYLKETERENKTKNKVGEATEEDLGANVEKEDVNMIPEEKEVAAVTLDDETIGKLALV